jgi:hypothetical protein
MSLGCLVCFVLGVMAHEGVCMDGGLEAVV